MALLTKSAVAEPNLATLVDALRAQIPAIGDRPVVAAAMKHRAEKQEELDRLERGLNEGLASPDELTRARAAVTAIEMQAKLGLLRIGLRHAEINVADTIESETIKAREDVRARYRQTLKRVMPALRAAYAECQALQALDIRANEVFSGAVAGLERVAPSLFARGLDHDASAFSEWVEWLRREGLFDDEKA